MEEQLHCMQAACLPLSIGSYASPLPQPSHQSPCTCLGLVGTAAFSAASCHKQSSSSLLAHLGDMGLSISCAGWASRPVPLPAAVGSCRQWRSQTELHSAKCLRLSADEVP